MRDLEAIKKRYDDAVQSITEKFKHDINVVAVILMGSLSYDTVWERSDVDMSIIVRDQKLDAHEFTVDEDGVNINVGIIQRSQFRRGFERGAAGGIGHSVISKGKIIYTNDESLYDYFEEMKIIGQDDMALALLGMCGDLIGLWEKIQKWLYVKQDLTYAQFYVLKAAEAMARMEVCYNLEPPTREAILRAYEINPDLFGKVYQRAMQGQMTADEIQECIDLFDNYLVSRMDTFTKPLLEYMSDHEMKTLSQFQRYFHMGGHYMVHIMDYLAEKGLVERVSSTIRVTPKGKQEHEEIAFIYLGEV